MNPFASLRWRLQLWHGMILVLVLVSFGVTSWQLIQANELRRIDGELRDRSAAILGALRRGRQDNPPPGFPRRGPGDPSELDGPNPTRTPGEFPPSPRDFRLGPREASLFEGGERSSFYYALWRRDGRELARSSNAPVELQAPSGTSRKSTLRMLGSRREMFEFTPPGECVLVGLDITPHWVALRHLVWPILLAGLAVLAMGVAGGSWFLNRALQPITQISATATKIANGDLSQRIPPSDTEDELGALTRVLNTTFARLENSFAQQAQFTSDASHELRTPVTVLLSQIQTTLARERTAADYRESLETCQRTAQRMRRLLESLLELARFDAGQEALKCQSVDLAVVVADCVEAVQPLASERGLQLRYEPFPVLCRGDSARLSQVVTNLLTNAVHYNRPHGKIEVITRAEKDTAVVRITDTGIGIAPADQARVFERFYRVDAARTTSTGRTGLGLAIVQAIVEAHGGTVDIESVAGSGTTFTVRLPLVSSSELA